MVKPRENEQPAAQQYDTTFKDWIRQQARDVLPLLLPGATYEDTLDVEVIKTTMRADKVFKIVYLGKVYIFNIEFESGSDNKITSRLLAYNAVLYHDHQIPVISMIVYPFKTTMAKSPLRIENERGDLLVFHFMMLPLFQQEAERYVEEHLVCMYPLLPTMLGTNHVMIKLVMTELKELYREDEVTLAQQFVWMNLLLERTETISPQEKGKIQKEISMYDRLWEESPKIQQIRAESKAEGEAEGLAQGVSLGIAEGIVQGEVRALQKMLVTIVKLRFPELAELAQQQAMLINKPDALELMVQKISVADDEKAVRWLLS